MLKKILYGMFIVAGGLLASCAGDEYADIAPAKSGLHLSLSGEDAVVTRATPATLGKPMAQQFALTVQNVKTKRVIYDGPFCEHVEAGNGTYLVTATYGQDLLLSIDQPYYKGEAEATLSVQDLNPQVTIACRVANALLSVKFVDRNGMESAAEVDDYFTSYAIRVTVENSYVNIDDFTQSAYFRAGSSPKVTFIGYLRDTGAKVTYDVPQDVLPTILEAAHHLVLKMRMEETSSGVSMHVVKAEVEHVRLEQTMPIEWLPKPRISAFGGDGELNYIETTAPSDEATIHISTYHALQDIEWEFNFAHEPLASALNGTYTLSTLTETQRELFATYGLTLPEAGAQYADACLDLRGMVAYLLTDNGETVENTVAMRVKANNRWSSETPQPFIINAVRPTFRMAVQQPGYAWAHSLYVTPLTAEDVLDTKGADVNDLLSSLVYDISDDEGQTWRQVSDVQGDLFYTEGLEAATSYLLRARVGEVMLSSTAEVATTEVENGVPNGDFEDLTTTISNLKLNEGGKYTVRVLFITADYQNTSTFTISEPKGWASVNAKTCNTSAATQNTWYMVPSTFNTTLAWDSYNSFHKASEGLPFIYRELEAQSGDNAMVVRNVSWDLNGGSIAKTGGNMNTNYFCETVPTVANTSSGKLFLGSYSYSGGQETYNEGTSFATRPTVLNGYYKYSTDGDNTEYGTAKVALLNGDVVIGEGEAQLTTCGGYGEFSVPITYTHYTLPATSLRIMFTSSRYASYDQAQESATVKTVAHCSGGTTASYDPGECCMRGATLTVDNLTFTYGK